MFRYFPIFLDLVFSLQPSIGKAQPKLEHCAYFVVQGNDTIYGFYDTLSLKDGKFEQYIETTFSGIGERKLHRAGGAKVNVNDRRETHLHATVSGELHNGAPGGEWLFYTCNFKNYSTCYGDLFWKRIEYSIPDTVVVTRWNGSDYFDKKGLLLGGERHCCLESGLVYSCLEGKCIIGMVYEEFRIEVPLAQIEMTLERISSFGF
jgi:hypothetical protein